MSSLWSYFFGASEQEGETQETPSSPHNENNNNNNNNNVNQQNLPPIPSADMTNQREIFKYPGSLYIWNRSGWDSKDNDCFLVLVDINQKYFLKIDFKEKSPSVHIPLDMSLQLNMTVGVLDCLGFSWALANSQSQRTVTQNVLTRYFLFEFDIDEQQNADQASFKLAQALYWNKTGKVSKDPAILGPLVPRNFPHENVTEEAKEIEPVTGETIFQFSSVPMQEYTQAERKFVPKGHVDFFVVFQGDHKKQFKYYLTLSEVETKKLMMVEPITSEMNQSFDTQQNSLTITAKGTTAYRILAFSFPQENIAQLQTLFAQAIFETNTQTPFTKIDKDWILSGYTKEAEIEEPDDELNEIAEEFDKLDFADEEDTQSESQESEASDVEEDEEWQNINKDATNSLLNVGSSSTFVTRGTQVGVFSVDAKSRNLKYRTRFDKIKTPGPSGQLFTPTKSMLHQRDSKMLLLKAETPDDRKKIFQMDLERGQVVEEWKVDDNYPVLELFPSTKDAQQSDTQIVQGLNSLGVCTIDPRLPKNKIVQSQSAFYTASSRPELSCAATTSTGQLALGSKKGDIRLFSSALLNGSRKADPLAAPRAKTTLPGFGDPIIGIDVSSDGKWILATCKTYLIVIAAETKSHKNGFENQMGKEKPAPRRLTLKYEDIKTMGGRISFTPAKFNLGEDLERSIVTSTGEFVVTWNFRKVKQNNLQEYKFRRYSAPIVEKSFTFGDSKNIVVTTPNNVSLAKRKKL